MTRRQIGVHRRVSRVAIGTKRLRAQAVDHIFALTQQLVQTRVTSERIAASDPRSVHRSGAEASRRSPDRRPPPHNRTSHSSFQTSRVVFIAMRVAAARYGAYVDSPAHRGDGRVIKPPHGETTNGCKKEESCEEGDQEA